MKNNFCPPEFFLGANTPYGFFSLFNQLYTPGTNWFCHILKGGPGTGKSTLMKNVAEKASKKKIKHEIIRCSSDPESLDAVILTDLNKCIVDGTAPHVIDPTYPGISDEIINLGEFWDSKALRENIRKISAASEKNTAFHKTAAAFLRAAGQISEGSFALALSAADTAKIKVAAEKLAKRYIPRLGCVTGGEQRRFLQGITPIGIVSYTDTVKSFFRERIIISDPYGCVGDIFMRIIRRYALEAGYNIITIKNAFLPELITDHILIPELSLAFVTENRYFDIGGDERRIHARRFTEPVQLRNIKQKLIIRRKLARELLKSACEALALAKNTHDELEKYYIEAMDFRSMTPLIKKLERDIFS